MRLWSYYYVWHVRNRWHPCVHDRPVLGWYGSDDPDALRQHVLWAKDAGMEGFLSKLDDIQYHIQNNHLLCQIADEIGGFNIGFHVNTYAFRDISHLNAHVRMIHSDFTIYNSTTRYGKTVVHMYAAETFPIQEWKQLLPKYQDKLFFLSDKWEREYAEVFDGCAPYTNLGGCEALDTFRREQMKAADLWHGLDKVFWAPICPGYDDICIRGGMKIPRDNRTYYMNTYLVSKACNPDAYVIVSWNEGPENSGIEPTVTWGNLYLDLTKRLHEVVEAPPCPPTVRVPAHEWILMALGASTPIIAIGCITMAQELKKARIL